MLNENFVIVGVLFNLVGTASYILDTVRGNIKPNRVTFLLWFLAPLVTFSAQVQQGVGMQSIMTLMVSFPPLAILLASFINKKAHWKISKFDLVCGALSLLGLLLWYITKIGNIAIAFGILADGLAALPTIVKSFYYPETESGWPWLASSINGLLTLLTITTWNFAHFGFPLYYTITVFIIFVLVQFKIGKHNLLL